MAQKNGEKVERRLNGRIITACVCIYYLYSFLHFLQFDSSFSSNRAKNDGNGDGIIKLLLKVPSDIAYGTDNGAREKFIVCRK
jgi:hypothetical protein